MTSNANTFVGAPAIAGMLYSAPADTADPTDATTPLPAIWAQLGAITADGIVRSGEPAVEAIKDAGNRTIRNIVTDHPMSYGLTFAEALNVDVLKELRGEGNVTVSADGKTITVGHVEGFISPARKYVIELEDFPNKKREIIKLAQAQSTGDVTYSAAAPGVVYEAVLNVLKPTDGTNVRVTEITEIDALVAA
ncbi:hypothetical protein RCH12_002775 [Cryobacterium sp. MP_3.1]|uniref:phage tail tube protein n=1 Tax=Cryobacterium sp. MP_3.1 TaxID=3071711 RepID=UPI002E00D43F|nr:hypothetical protein [Cryobacterium sp. MP_3.1]